MLAASQGDIQAARILLSAGADVNARFQQGTALAAARRAKHKEVVELLREAGAKK